MKRFIAVVLLFTGMLLTASVNRAGALENPPDCYDFLTQQYVTATKWLTSPGTLVGTSKRDVLVGSTGADVIKGLGGNDVICSSPLGEALIPENEYDQIDPGSGNDSVIGAGTAKASSGNDIIQIEGVGSAANGGSGDDVIVVGSGIANGGSGNDMIYGFSATELNGDSGNDMIVNENGNPKIDCGSGRDSVEPDNATVVRRCESVGQVV